MSLKPVTLAPIRPNVGVEARYQRRLQKAVDDMHRSLAYWLLAAYRANEPELATDESPAMALRNAMKKLARRWTKEFDRLANQWGPDFCRSALGVNDVSFRNALRKAGFTVRFRLTPAVNDVLQASIGENVSLIKSIAQQHLVAVEGAVMRAVQTGRDAGGLAQELVDAYGVTRRRAAFIAIDQNNKATAAITRARQEELGIVEAILVHSAAGKTPRPSHVAMNGQPYDVSKGMWDPDEQKWIRPGELIRCRCTSRSIIPGLRPN